MGKKKKEKCLPLIVRGFSDKQWIEVKHNGKLYLVCLSTLLNSYDREQARD